jgi:hypothetical protein
MGRSDMQRVYRLLKEARERDIIPWEWIVDETREIAQREYVAALLFSTAMAQVWPCSK